jgi:hypothetical protein
MKRFVSLSALLIVLFSISFSQTKMIINMYNGTSDSVSLSEIKGITFNSNIIRNGDFNSSLNDWILIGQGTNPYHPEDPGSAVFSIENGVLKIDIKNQGTWEYSIMVYQSINFEKGASYVVSFDAMSDTSMQIISNITQDVTWINYTGDISFHLTNVMASYSYQFTMPVNGAALFQFCLGNMGARKIYIDNISVRKK